MRGLALLVALALVAQAEPPRSFVQDIPLDWALLRLRDPEREAAVPLRLGLGSAAFRRPSDPPDRVYLMTDRGPSLEAAQAALRLGAPLPAATGTVFPLPGFSPSIYRVRLYADRFELLDVVAMKNAAGRPLTGLPNPGGGTLLDGAGRTLSADPEGLDPEGLVVLSDGSAWVAEEYAPSLVQLAPNGRVLDRLVPRGLTGLERADYRVSPVLPAHYARRRPARGFESLAISGDGAHLYAMLQAPLQHTTETGCRSVRLLVVDRAAKVPLAEFAYVVEPAERFANDRDARPTQADVKVSELCAVAPGVLLVLERIEHTTLLFRVDLTGATNLLEYAGPALEDSAEPPEGVVPLAKRLVFDSAVDAPELAAKIEGVAHLGGGELLLVNDNDFGVAGATTQFTRVRVALD